MRCSPGREPAPGHRHRRPVGGGQVDGRPRPGPAARLPLPRHGGDVPRAGPEGPPLPRPPRRGGGPRGAGPLRAAPRHAELAATGTASDVAAIEREIRARDHADSTRSDSPLTRAPDAIYLDTTGLAPDEVVQRMAAAVEEKLRA